MNKDFDKLLEERLLQIEAFRRKANCNDPVEYEAVCEVNIPEEILRRKVSSCDEQLEEDACDIEVWIPTPKKREEPDPVPPPPILLLESIELTKDCSDYVNKAPQGFKPFGPEIVSGTGPVTLAEGTFKVSYDTLLIGEDTPLSVYEVKQLNLKLSDPAIRAAVITNAQNNKPREVKDLLGISWEHASVLTKDVYNIFKNFATKTDIQVLGLLDCYYINAEFIAECPPDEFGNAAASNDSNPIFIPSGTVKSTVSQADADRKVAALTQASLNCYFFNEEVTVVCEPVDIVVPNDEAPPNPEVTEELRVGSYTIQANTVRSVYSQEEANEQARNVALTMLNCLYYNEETVVYCESIEDPETGISYPALGSEGHNPVIVPANSVYINGYDEEALASLIQDYVDALLVCQWGNPPITVTCPPDTYIKYDNVGNSITVVNPADPDHSEVYSYTVPQNTFITEGGPVEARELAYNFALAQLACAYCNDPIEPVCETPPGALWNESLNETQGITKGIICSETMAEAQAVAESIAAQPKNNSVQQAASSIICHYGNDPITAACIWPSGSPEKKEKAECVTSDVPALPGILKSFLPDTYYLDKLDTTFFADDSREIQIFDTVVDPTLLAPESCPSGNEKIEIPANTLVTSTNREDANRAAMGLAKAMLECVYCNEPKLYNCYEALGMFQTSGSSYRSSVDTTSTGYLPDDLIEDINNIRDANGQRSYYIPVLGSTLFGEGAALDGPSDSDGDLYGNSVNFFNRLAEAKALTDASSNIFDAERYAPLCNLLRLNRKHVLIDVSNARSFSSKALEMTLTAEQLEEEYETLLTTEGEALFESMRSGPFTLTSFTTWSGTRGTVAFDNGFYELAGPAASRTYPSVWHYLEGVNRSRFIDVDNENSPVVQTIENYYATFSGSEESKILYATKCEFTASSVKEANALRDAVYLPQLDCQYASEAKWYECFTSEGVYRKGNSTSEPYVSIPESTGYLPNSLVEFLVANIGFSYDTDPLVSEVPGGTSIGAISRPKLYISNQELALALDAATELEDGTLWHRRYDTVLSTAPQWTSFINDVGTDANHAVRMEQIRDAVVPQVTTVLASETTPTLRRTTTVKPTYIDIGCPAVAKLVEYFYSTVLPGFISESDTSKPPEAYADCIKFFENSSGERTWVIAQPIVYAPTGLFKSDSSLEEANAMRDNVLAGSLKCFVGNKGIVFNCYTHGEVFRPGTKGASEDSPAQLKPYVASTYQGFCYSRCKGFISDNVLSKIIGTTLQAQTTDEDRKTILNNLNTLDLNGDLNPYFINLTDPNVRSDLGLEGVSTLSEDDLSTLIIVDENAVTGTNMQSVQAQAELLGLPLLDCYIANNSDLEIACVDTTNHPAKPTDIALEDGLRYAWEEGVAFKGSDGEIVQLYDYETDTLIDSSVTLGTPLANTDRNSPGNSIKRVLNGVAFNLYYLIRESVHDDYNALWDITESAINSLDPPIYNSELTPGWGTGHKVYRFLEAGTIKGDSYAAYQLALGAVKGEVLAGCDHIRRMGDLYQHETYLGTGPDGDNTYTTEKTQDTAVSMSVSKKAGSVDIDVSGGTLDPADVASALQLAGAAGTSGSLEAVIKRPENKALPNIDTSEPLPIIVKKIHEYLKAQEEGMEVEVKFKSL